MGFRIKVVLALGGLCHCFIANAAEAIIYPAQGQSVEQLASDKGACYAWATESTGVNPAALAQAAPITTPTAAPAPGRPRLAGAARGALGGAIIGEIVDDDAGKGAAAGAVAGTMVGGSRARQQQAQQQQQVEAQQQQQQQQAQAQQSQLDTYNRAFSACMQGRGYTLN